MSELQHLADTIHRAQNGDAWHGPALGELLEGITAEVAARHAGGTHTIWELTEHIAAWQNIIRRRMEGERLTDDNISWEDNWPPVRETSEAGWRQTVARAAEASRRLEERVLGFDPKRLEEQVQGKDYSFAVMLHGAAQHLLYHAGQIALLKKWSEAPSK